MSGILELVDGIISAGPRVGEAMEEVTLAVEDARSCVGHLHQAGVIISGRAARAEEAVAALDAAETTKVEELGAKVDEVSPDGRRGLLTSVFAFIKANPWLLELLLSQLRPKS